MKQILGASVLALFGLLPWAATPDFSDWSPAVNLGAVINTRYSDSCMTVSKDELTLIFSSNRQSPGTIDRDLYLSARTDKGQPWGSPVPLAKLNTPNWESCPALGLDEYDLYFTSDRPGGCGAADIWVAHRHDRGDALGWESPFNLGCERDGYVNSNKEDLMPAFFEDDDGHLLMYYSSNRPTAKSFDLYQSVMRSNGTFGPPRPVEELNTHDYDSSPAVRRDGLEIIFGSNRAGGSGTRYSEDFWTATRTSTAMPWSTPTFVPSLGSPAWMQGRIALTFDGRSLYFTSLRPGGSGGADLWGATRDKTGQ
jgi:hypothetical protein